MTERAGRLRGWYLDPTDPTTVRHWDGDRWGRARIRPAWSISAGDLVVDVEGRFDAARPWAGPVVEGPARPANDRAAAGALGMGTEPVRGRTRPAALRSGSGSHGSRAGHFSPVGASNDFVSGPPWAVSRRPMAIFALVVVVALVAVAASVVGRPTRTLSSQAPIPSGFVAQASRGCVAMLGARRPATLPVDPMAVSAEVAQITTLTKDLRNVALATGATFQTGSWLDGWQRFTADEAQRAAALGATPVSSPASAASPPSGSATTASPAALPGAVHAVMGAPDPAAVALRSQSEAATADHFAAVNGLQACTILARGGGSVQTIPS
ncbi:MAG: hypothetical protein M3Y36_11790 [Actinomycetota bacterium]|nr:hypothetical protein [Actinomycetota bacterium]